MPFSIASAVSSLRGSNPLSGGPLAASSGAPAPSVLVAPSVELAAESTAPTLSATPSPAAPVLEDPATTNRSVHANYTHLTTSLAAPVASCSLAQKKTAKLPPLVLIHGLKGGHLKDQVTNKRRYLKVSQLFNPTRFQDPPTLPLVRDPLTGAQAKDTLVPDGIIDDVTLLGINLASFYGPFQAEFGASRTLETFSYDWRRELNESGESLEKFLEKVIEDTGSEEGVQVVCHSMGGLIAFPLINRRPELFHSVLFAAAALGGGVSFLRDLAEPGQGNGMGPINSSMFTPQRWIGWPSVWSFFNLTGEREVQGKSEITRAPLSEADGTTPVPCDFHNLQDWKRLKLGPYGPDSGVSEVTPEMEAFLQATLNNAKAYREQLVHNPDVTYPPIAVLRSDAVPTITRLRRPAPGAAFDYSTALTTPGDGRITLEDTLPPRGVPITGIITNHAAHSGILSELDDVKGLLGKLIDAANARKEAAAV